MPPNILSLTSYIHLLQELTFQISKNIQQQLLINMHFSQALIILTAAALLDQTLAHPGHDIREEISERNEFFKNNKRKLDHCSNSLKKRGMQGSQQKRREAAIAKARAERGLPQSQYSDLS